MAEIGGTQGSATANGQTLEGSEWTFDGDQAAPDRSNWTTAGEPLNAAGQRTGTISMSGPVSTTSNLTGKGVTRGTVVAFVLIAAGGIRITVSGRVTKVGYRQNKDNGTDWNITAQQYGSANIQGM